MQDSQKKIKLNYESYHIDIQGVPDSLMQENIPQ